MIWSLPLLGFVLGSLPLGDAQSSSGNNTGSQLPAVLNSTYIQTLGNNSLFLRWRPSYHFISPAGWMNVSGAFLTSSIANMSV
jgi:beta-fructofuranosidase